MEAEVPWLKSRRKRFAAFVLKAAAVAVIVAAPPVFCFGVPLSGLPEVEDIERVEITYSHNRKRKVFRDAEDTQLARRAVGMLRRLPFAAFAEEDPRYTLVFVEHTGERSA